MKHRLQFDFDDHDYAALKSMVRRGGTMAQVVRRALAMYRHIAPAIANGASVVLRNPDGTETLLVEVL